MGVGVKGIEGGASRLELLQLRWRWDPLKCAVHVQRGFCFGSSVAAGGRVGKSHLL